MKTIPLTHGKFTTVDDGDYPEQSIYKWHVAKGGYAARREGGVMIYLHCVLLGVTQEQEGDHRNGNTLDNRRFNLRACTHAQNMKNMRRHRDNKSGFKGVDFVKCRGKFRAAICSDGIRIHLGCFPTAKEAASAYRTASLIHHGEFGRTD